MIQSDTQTINPTEVHKVAIIIFCLHSCPTRGNCLPRKAIPILRHMLIYLLSSNPVNILHNQDNINILTHPNGKEKENIYIECRTQLEQVCALYRVLSSMNITCRLNLKSSAMFYIDRQSKQTSSEQQ